MPHFSSTCARAIARPSLVLLLTALALPVAGQSETQTGNRPEPPLGRQERLEKFRRLTPAARLRLLEKLPQAGRLFDKVSRGSIRPTVLERGVVDATTNQEVICRVKAKSPANPVATTIKWVVDDGAVVKRGDRLVDFDDSSLKEQLEEQKIREDQAVAERNRAAAEFELVKKEHQIEFRLAEIAVRLAELDLKSLADAEAEKRQIAELKVEQTKLLLERTRARSKNAESQAAAEVRTKSILVAQAEARRKDIEAELRQCVVTASHDGLVVFETPPQARVGIGTAIVAQGESVREGQKLLRMLDLKRPLLVTRIHEAQIARVRPGQRALVRVDAFPDRLVSAEVTQVATNAVTQDWFSADVKVYPTQLSLPDAPPGLKPGMSAEVCILLEERADVLRQPVQSVLGAGKERYCYVKTAAGLEERRVIIGLRDDEFAEVKQGVSDEDVILRDPAAVLSRGDLWPTEKPPAPPNRRGQATPGTHLRVQSIRPPQSDGRRALLEAYGLTYSDLERLARLPTVTQLVPVRVFPQEMRRLDRKLLGQVIATTSAFPDRTGLSMAAGRFLIEDDNRERRNVAVLGSEVAQTLFPDDDPLGKSVLCGGHLYSVIGVAGEQTDSAGRTTRVTNRAVYLPLSTCQARFGTRLATRRAGSFHSHRGPRVVRHPRDRRCRRRGFANDGCHSRALGRSPPTTGLASGGGVLSCSPPNANPCDKRRTLRAGSAPAPPQACELAARPTEAAGGDHPGPWHASLIASIAVLATGPWRTILR